VLVPPDQLSLRSRERSETCASPPAWTGWKIDHQNALEYDPVAEDAKPLN